MENWVRQVLLLCAITADRHVSPRRLRELDNCFTIDLSLRTATKFAIASTIFRSWFTFKHCDSFFNGHDCTENTNKKNGNYKLVVPAETTVSSIIWCPYLYFSICLKLLCPFLMMVIPRFVKNIDAIFQYSYFCSEFVYSMTLLIAKAIASN